MRLILGGPGWFVKVCKIEEFCLDLESGWNINYIGGGMVVGQDDIRKE